MPAHGADVGASVSNSLGVNFGQGPGGYYNSTDRSGPYVIGSDGSPHLLNSVTQSGSTGSDYSVNAASVPISGYSLLQTIPATPGRNYVEVQNQSAAQVQVVRDDGAGNNQTSILLASGGSAGSQGGSWSSSTFKGRVRIYGASGAQIAAYQD